MSDKLRGILRILGLEDRFRREMISTSEGILYTRIIEEMVSHLKKLGPSPLRKESSA
jgi:coenzyme F420-reducing hydrogenase delta subunit